MNKYGMPSGAYCIRWRTPRDRGGMLPLASRSRLFWRYVDRATAAAWSDAFRDAGPCEALASRDPVVGSRP